MQPSQSSQFELNFEAPPSHALEDWRQERKNAMREVARRMGLPIGAVVEVWLQGEIRLRGTLRLQEQLLMPEAFDPAKLVLEVDRVPFVVGDMVSCVRTD